MICSKETLALLEELTQAIGVTGNTGISRGAHLHYEITEGGSRVNPLNYLPGYVKSW